ncbi:hypothetical protein Taro_038685 [Colocasia esculenta]|uniref:Uncharacterized protein n=1 Tax=Colocasia esculenta TaxID=4460 RepID=A0A843WJZ9_COLES|nr:hypothetical protein [Colocasia esculenta]
MLKCDAIGKDVMDGKPMPADSDEKKNAPYGKGAILVLEVDFLVVKVKSAYNAIFCRSLFGKLGGIPSTYHQKLKFSMPNGISEVVGNQTEARRCYVNSIKAKELVISEYEFVPIESSERDSSGLRGLKGVHPVIELIKASSKQLGHLRQLICHEHLNIRSSNLWNGHIQIIFSISLSIHWLSMEVFITALIFSRLFFFISLLDVVKHELREINLLTVEKEEEEGLVNLGHKFPTTILWSNKGGEDVMDNAVKCLESFCVLRVLLIIELYLSVVASDRALVFKLDLVACLSEHILVFISLRVEGRPGDSRVFVSLRVEGRPGGSRVF